MWGLNTNSSLFLNSFRRTQVKCKNKTIVGEPYSLEGKPHRSSKDKLGSFDFIWKRLIERCSAFHVYSNQPGCCAQQDQEKK